MFGYGFILHSIGAVRKVLKDSFLPLWYSCGFLTAFTLFVMFRLPYYNELVMFATGVSLFGTWEMCCSMVSRFYRVGVIVHRRSDLKGIWGRIFFPVLVVSEFISSSIRPIVLLFRPFFNLNAGSGIIGVVVIFFLLGWLSFILVVLYLSTVYSFEWFICVLQWYVMGMIVIFSRWQ